MKKSANLSALILLLCSFVFSTTGVVSADEKKAEEVTAESESKGEVETSADADKKSDDKKKTDGDKKKDKDGEEPECE